MIYFILVIVCLIVLYWFIKKIFGKEKEDTAIMFSGSMGTGKTLNMVRRQKKLRAKAIREIKKNNKKFGTDYDFVLYSNFPIQYKRKGKLYLSQELTTDMILLQEPMAPQCICVIDEFGSFISQFDYNIKNIDKLDEHIRLWRHYHGNASHLIVADQCSNNIVLQLRRRFNKVINCIETKWYFNGLIHITKYRVISISDEIKTIEELKSNLSDKQENETDLKYKRYIGFHIPRIIKKFFHIYREYDDLAYSNRYNKTFHKDLVEQSVLKTDKLLKWNNTSLPNKIEEGVYNYGKEDV